METRLNAKALTGAGAIAGGVLNTLCFTIYLVLGRPDPWMELFVGAGPTVGGWLVGIAEGAGVGALLGWLVAVCYNGLAKPAAAER